MTLINTSFFRADIHCHSNCSDGSDSPLNLLDHAKFRGLQGISITDHDTTAAYSDDLFLKAKSLGIEILSGVEISTELEGTAVHILGYGFDLYDLSFSDFLQNIRIARNQRNREILKKLELKNMLITELELIELTQSVGKQTTIGRPHIADLMVQKKYVRSIQEAFDLYLKDDAPCYVSGFKHTPMDAIEKIHQAKGKAVLAHPHFMKKGHVLQKLLLSPFDGIECFYGTLRQNQEAPWVKIAKQKKWIITGGSDYHGFYKPHISLGCSWVDFATFQSLLNK